jgi:hypothetical protein
MARIKPVNYTTSVGDLIEAFFADMEELASEVREAYDNAPDSLKQSERNQTLEQTASSLEDLRAPDEPTDFPESLRDHQCTYHTYEQRRPTRAGRRDRAVDGLTAAIEAIRAWADKEDEELNAPAEPITPEQQDELDNTSDEAKALVERMREERADLLQSMRDYADALEEAKDEADGAEFPGIRG